MTQQLPPCSDCPELAAGVIGIEVYFYAGTKPVVTAAMNYHVCAACAPKFNMTPYIESGARDKLVQMVEKTTHGQVAAERCKPVLIPYRSPEYLHLAMQLMKRDNETGLDV
jgi:hypothetical protein